MKKINLLLAFSFAYYSQVAAQVQFGVKAGTTLSNYVFTGKATDKPASATLVSFYAGATVGIPLSASFSFQTGLTGFLHILSASVNSHRKKTNSCIKATLAFYFALIASCKKDKVNEPEKR